jgi:uncharacterized metal-binding protein
MPNGAVHSLATVLIAGATGFGTYHYGLLDKPHAIALGCGALVGLLLTPDLDVDTGSDSDDWARRLLGRAGGFMWWLIWRPYAALVPHRSPLSHFPILGTVLRLGYLSLVALVVAWLLHLAAPVHIPAVSMPWWFPLGFIGLTLADLGHWILDNTIRMPRSFSNGYRKTYKTDI